MYLWRPTWQPDVASFSALLWRFATAFSVYFYRPLPHRRFPFEVRFVFYFAPFDLREFLALLSFRPRIRQWAVYPQKMDLDCYLGHGDIVTHPPRYEISQMRIHD